MQEALEAFLTGRADALERRRDPARADHPETGVDYRRGFLDGRLDVFRMHAATRRLLEDRD